MNPNTQSDQDQAYFIKNFREIAGITYIVVCIFDFVLAPILTAIYFGYTKTPYIPWVPLTTMGGGMFHISFGAILGVSSYMRGLSQVEAIRNLPDYSNMPYTPYHPPLGPPAPVPYVPGAMATVTTQTASETKTTSMVP